MTSTTSRTRPAGRTTPRCFGGSSTEIPLRSIVGPRAQSCTGPSLSRLRPPSVGADLCSTFIELLPITGASVSVFDASGRQSTICASDAVAARVEEMQFALGEGPHWEALSTGLPVLVPDLRNEEQPRWPVFADAVLEAGVGALFSFPMRMGAITVGVVDLYRTAPGALGANATAQARSLAAMAAGPAAREAIRSADDESAGAGTAPEMRREVHQATGMVLVQLNTTATDAFLRLRSHAFASGRTVQDVAHDVVTRRLDFSDVEME